MVVLDSLKKIKDIWITKVSRRLARGEGTRILFRVQLESFHGLMSQAIESGDPAWLNPILDEWVEARTQTDLENPDNTLVPFLEQILLATNEVANENMEETEALQFIGAILPIFTYAFGYAAKKETILRGEHISKKFEGARQSLERLDRSKSDFIAIAAHELKTPLTLIEGYASMFKDRLTDMDGGSQNLVLLKGIENGTLRLRQIVDDMIDVSMIDNQMLSLNFQPVWINRLLLMVQNEFRPIVMERNLTLEIRSFMGSEEMTFGDEERLFQALRNVISNAIKYTPDKGAIRVDGRLLPGFVEILIEDTGIGIDPEFHATIFEKFGWLGEAALHSSGKTKFKGGGPGLGLPITKGIVEAHGGTIWVESEGYDEVKCPGSKFHILLPIRKEPPDKKMATLFRTSLQTGELRDPYG
jgi:signal transduction histidine kinase